MCLKYTNTLGTGITIGLIGDFAVWRDRMNAPSRCKIVRTIGRIEHRLKGA